MEWEIFLLQHHSKPQYRKDDVHMTPGLQIILQREPTCIHTHIHIHTNIHTCMHMHKHTHACTHIYTDIRIQVMSKIHKRYLICL